jgi:hypothetical protein
MAVFRVEKTQDYTVMSNYHLRDKNLSLKAKGLLCWMLSNTDDWDYSVEGIVAVMKESRDAICSALTELEDYGYLTRRKLRDGGKFGGVEYLITELPFTENPYTEKPKTENPKQINTNINKYQSNKSLPKGKEEQAPKKSYKEIFEAPENKIIKDALVTFINYCKGKNYNPRVETVEKFAKTLRDNAKDNASLAMDMVNQSINNGWKSIYKLKKKIQKQTAVYKPFNPDTDTLAKNENGELIVY